MENHRKHMAIFAGLTMLIDGMNGELNLQGKTIKKAYLDEKSDCYMVEYNNGEQGLAYEVDSDVLFAEINDWRIKDFKNFQKFKEIFAQ